MTSSQIYAELTELTRNQCEEEYADLTYAMNNTQLCEEVKDEGLLENKKQGLKNGSHRRRIPVKPAQRSSSTNQDVRLKENEESEMFSSRILFVSYLAFLSILVVVLTAAAATVIFLFLKVLALEKANQEDNKSLMYSYNGFLNLMNKYDVLNNKSHQMTITIQSLIDAFNNTQTELNNLNTSITPLIDKRNHLNKIIGDITVEVQRLSDLMVDNYHSSCLAISQLNLSYISGNYILKSSSGVLVSVFCNLNMTSGNSSNVTNNTVVDNSTERIRLAELDVNNCPQGLRSDYVYYRKTCVVVNDEAGCTEIHYPTNNTNYTHIMGRVQGFQSGSMDCFNGIPMKLRHMNSTAFSNYIDGVSIVSNGEHIWSFAAGCSCDNIVNKPDFVGEHFTADGRSMAVGSGYSSTVLWESQMCGTNEDMFERTIEPTTSNVTVRICRDQDRSDEDLALFILNIYVQ